MEPINTQKEYQEYVDKKSPNSPIWKNCFNAFWVGGLICSIGQIIMDICKYKGLSQELSGTVVSIILIAISAFFTGLNIFNKIGKFAGAGSLIPITGFANSIVSYFVMFGSLGIGTYAVREITRNKDNQQEIAKTVKEILSINFSTIPYSTCSLSEIYQSSLSFFL